MVAHFRIRSDMKNDQMLSKQILLLLYFLWWLFTGIFDCQNQIQISHDDKGFNSIIKTHVECFIVKGKKKILKLFFCLISTFAFRPARPACLMASQSKYNTILRLIQPKRKQKFKNRRDKWVVV